MIEIRPARPGEAQALSALAYRSKAHWGYTVDQMETFRDELTLAPEDLSAQRVHVAEESGIVVGFYSLESAVERRCELGHLFVEPSQLSRGIGRLLFEHACATARSDGCETLGIRSDPHADGFYRALGATPGGHVPSGAPGRILPWFTFALAPSAGSTFAVGPHDPTPGLSAARGFAYFLLYVGARQALAAMAIAFGVHLASRGDASPGAVRETDFESALGFSGLLLGDLLVTGFLLVRYRGSASLREAVGLRSASADRIVFGLCCGAALGVVSLAHASWSGLDASSAAGAVLEPLTESASLDQKLHVAFVLLASPLFEEFVFRGVVLACFTASWGLIPAAIATTVLFVGIHPEAIAESVWAVPLLALLSLMSCYLRVRTKSLVPSICAHFGYNAIIIGTVHATLVLLAPG